MFACWPQVPLVKHRRLQQPGSIHTRFVGTSGNPVLHGMPGRPGEPLPESPKLQSSPSETMCTRPVARRVVRWLQLVETAARVSTCTEEPISKASSAHQKFIVEIRRVKLTSPSRPGETLRWCRHHLDGCPVNRFSGLVVRIGSYGANPCGDRARSCERALWSSVEQTVENRTGMPSHAA